MYLIYTFLIFFVIHLHNGECWFHFFYSNCNNNTGTKNTTSSEDCDDLNNNDVKLPDIPNHLDDICCPVSFKTIINPYTDRITERVDVIPACVKCAICLAVAENVERVFTSAVSNDENCSPDCEVLCLKTELNSLCKNGFVNYDLREIDGLSLITNIYAKTRHVRTPMDGLWTQMVRSSCQNLLERLEVFDVYNAYKISKLNITNYLCRGFGVFRDCNNIVYEMTHVPDDDMSMRFWVSCLFV